MQAAASASVALQAFLILLREGMEAILVLAVLAALLRRMAPERIGALWAGAGLGLLASLLTAGAYAAWRGGVHDDWVEGVTCLAAGGLMSGPAASSGAAPTRGPGPRRCSTRRRRR